MKAVKVIDSTGQFYGGGVSSKPKVAPVPKEHMEKLGRRVCTVLLTDSRNIPDVKNLFDKAKQNHSGYTQRRKEVLYEGLKTLKKLISTPPQESSFKQLTNEKIDKLGKSFK
jgi:hypothetical protein